MTTVGNTGTGSTPFLKYPGRLQAVRRFTGIAGGGTLTYLGLDVAPSAGPQNIVLGLFTGTATSVGTLIGQTATMTTSTHLNIGAAASGAIPDGGYLWLVVGQQVTDSDGINIYTDSGEAALDIYQGSTITAYPSMPAWGLDDTYPASQPAAGYFSYTPAYTAPDLTIGLPTGTTNPAPSISCTTSIALGTARFVIDTAGNLAGVTATQVLAGQKAAGTAAAYFSNTITVSSTNISTTAISGIAAGTYTIAAAQNDGTSDSNVLTWTITVDATAPTFSVGPFLTNITSSNYTVMGTSSESGTAKILVTGLGAGQPSNAAFDALVPGVSSDAVNITAATPFQINH